MTTLDRHAVSVYFGETTAPAKSADVKLDRGWAPYVQGQIVVPMAPDIDPREGDRVRVLMRQTFGESVPASALSAEFAGETAAEMSLLWAGKSAADVSALYFAPYNRFGVRSSTTRSLDLTVLAASTNIRARETTVEVASDEAIAQGAILVQSSPQAYSLTSIRSLVAQVLPRIGAYLLDGTADGVIEATSTTWEPGTSVWDFLAPLVQKTGLRLWCDGQRAWRLDDAEENTPGGIVLSSRDRVKDATIRVDVDRGGWADAVVIRYDWRDEAGVQHTRYDVAGPGRPRRGVLLRYEQPYPGPGAAAHVLRRRQRRGWDAPVVAVSDYSTEPGMSFVLTVDTLPQHAGRVQSVQWRFPGDDMIVEPVGLEDVNPHGIAAIPPAYQITELPGTITQLAPGGL